MVMRGSDIVGELEIDMRSRLCKNYWHILDRWWQSNNDDVFGIDNTDRLVHVKWSDIDAGMYDRKTVVDTDVDDFYAVGNQIGILYKSGMLKVPKKQADLDLKKINKDAKWTLLI